MKGSIGLLNELFEIANDGQKFYFEVAGKVESTEVESIFRDQAEARARIVKNLSDYVAADGETSANETTLLGEVRELYADLRAVLNLDSDAVYASRLEAMEDRLLDHYKQAIEEMGDDDVRTALLNHLPTVQLAHNRMRALKQRYAA